MTDHRRQFDRQPGPFDGAWNGAAGSHACRITSLSPSGCFVDSATTPETGSPFTVSVVFGDTRFTMPADVVYRDPAGGFGVRFPASDQSRALAYAMGAGLSSETRLGHSNGPGSA
jgi:hypothetical protein